MTSEIDYLLSLEAVRERSRLVFAAAQRDELCHFTYHASKLPEAAAFVTSVINVSSAIASSIKACFVSGIRSFTKTRNLSLDSCLI